MARAVVYFFLVAAMLVAAAWGSDENQDSTLRPEELLMGQLREPTPGESWCFLSFGCWGGKNKHTQAAVARAMAADAEQRSHPLFVIAAGDNFYPSGVKSVRDSRFATTFEDVYVGRALESVPWLVALGNHDYRGNITAQVAYTFDRAHNQRRRWYLPRRYYSTRGIDAFPSSLLILVLDCPLLERCHNNGDNHERCADRGEQWQWVEQELEADRVAHGFRWRVAVCHYPMHANGPHINHEWLTSWLQPLLEKFCVALYINADNHYLQLSRANDVFYVNSGGGAGYGLRHTHQHKGYKRSGFSVFEEIQDGFVRHCVDPEAGVLRSTFVNEKGEELHTFSASAATLAAKCRLSAEGGQQSLLGQDISSSSAAGGGGGGGGSGSGEGVAVAEVPAAGTSGVFLMPLTFIVMSLLVYVLLRARQRRGKGMSFR